MNDPLIDLATVPATPIHAAVLAARTPVGRVVGDLLAVPDGRLGAEWRWRPTDVTDVNDLDVRYGFYRIHERLESAIGEIEVGRAGVPGVGAIGPAVPPLEGLAAARWDLHGVLASLDEAALDADPGGGEWTVRETLGHIVGGQLSYGWFNAWFLANPVPVGEAVRPDESVFPPEPTDAELGAGPLAEVRARFDAIVDDNISAVAGLDRSALDLGARWSGQSVSIAFRLGRYGSHLREHTVQVDKTLAILRREPTEVERLVRLILATYGRLEALVIGRPAADLERPLADGSSALGILAEALADAEETAASVRATATVG